MRFARYLGAISALVSLLSAWSTHATQVTDDAGAVLQLAQPARRIVSLSPAATETLFALGAGDSVVGTSAYSDYPEAAKRVPRVGDAFTLNRERVAQLRPDLVIVWGSGTPAQRVAELRTLGIPVFISEPRSSADIASTLERFGALTGHPDAGMQAARQFVARMNALRHRFSRQTAYRVFLQISDQPLMTVNRRHALTEALGLCGATNVFADLPLLAAQISREAVLAQDPDVIVAIEPHTTATATLAVWRTLGARAARERRIAAVSPDLLSRAAPSFADGVEVLCETLASFAPPR